MLSASAAVVRVSLCPKTVFRALADVAIGPEVADWRVLLREL